MRAADNPFRTERVEALSYRAPGFDWGELSARLTRQGGRGAIRGGQGSGKTTLLHELGDRLADEGYEVRRLRPDLEDAVLAREQLRRFPTGTSRRTALLLDGADRVGPWAWRRLIRETQLAGMLVVTTHREGRLPTLHRCATNAELLAELVADLLTESGPDLRLGTTELYARSGGNLRLALRELYDVAASGSYPIASQP